MHNDLDMGMIASLIIRTFQLVFFSRNSVFLSQQIGRNSVLSCFFSKANGAMVVEARNAFGSGIFRELVINSCLLNHFAIFDTNEHLSILQ